MTLRKSTSLTALLSFILLAFTSVVVYIAPHGRQSGQWEWLGLEKHRWQALHTNLGILLLVACIVHIVLNIRPIVAYLRNKHKKLRIFTWDFNVALLLTGWIVASTLLDLPPINIIQKYKAGQRHAMTRKSESPAPELKTEPFPGRPPFRFGSKILSTFCAEYDLDEAAVVEGLRNLGIENQPNWSIRKIAETNKMEPYSIFEAIEQLHAQ